MEPITFTFPGFKKLYLGFKSLYQGKFSFGVPLSNDYVIVFPIASSDKRFSRKIYSPEMTNQRASCEEIDKVLSLFELTSSQSLSTFEMLKTFCWSIFVPFMMLIFLQGNYMFRHAEIIWFCFISYWAVGIFYFFAKRNAQIKRAIADNKRIIDLVQPDFSKKGLRWHLPEGSSGWIELIKEYRENEMINPPATSYAKTSNQYEPPQNVV